MKLSLLLLCAWFGAGAAQPASPGVVVAWGYNGSGQTTVPDAAQKGVTAIAAGGNHTVALSTNGTVVAWGDNGLGQTTVPTGLGRVRAIAAGAYHTVALKGDGSGTVVAWGDNSFGQTAVPFEAQFGVIAIAAGFYFTVALKDDGSVLAWGQNNHGQTIVPTGLSEVTAIAAGSFHTAALKSDGSVLVWGRSWEGQTDVPVAAQSGVTAIAAGGSQFGGHTVALKNDGSVLAWGDNYWGQTDVPVAAQSGVTAIAAGGDHTVTLKTDGSVLAWGDNRWGQTTVPVAAQSGVMAIAAGGDDTVAIVRATAPAIITQPVSQAVNAGQSASFTVVATGYPLYYQWRKAGTNLSGATGATCSLGLARTNQAGTYTVVVSNFLGSVTSAPQAVLTVNPAIAGSVVAWGRNDDGETTVPVTAQGVATAIAAGYAHTMALKNDGSVLAWGDDDWGQTTVAVAAQSGVTAIAAGGAHTVALLGGVVPLNARRSGNKFILSWLANGTVLKLQSTLALTPAAAWVDVTNAPALLGAQWTVTNTFSGSAQFYRLRKL